MQILKAEGNNTISTKVNNHGFLIQIYLNNSKKMYACEYVWQMYVIGKRYGDRDMHRLEYGYRKISYISRTKSQH